MPQPLTGVLVVIASPGDATEERAVVRDRLNDWNVDRGRREQVALLPWLWERHAVASMGGRPQALINAQAVDQADIVVAFFDSRLGTSTGVDVSGTAEEVNRAVELGKPVHVYFSREPLPRDVDPDQLKALAQFKEGLANRGLLGDYVDASDLAGQVVRAVEADVVTNGWAGNPPLPTRPSGTRLRWQHRHEREQKGLDRRGKVQYRTTVNDLVVTNEGVMAAEDLIFEVEPINNTQFLIPDPPDGPVTVFPDSSMSWTLIPTPSWGNNGNTIAINASWREGQEAKTATWTVALASG